MEYGRGDSVSSSSSLKQRIRSSNCFSCCFRGYGGEGDALDSAGESRPPSLIRSSSVWIRSRAQDLPELKDKCRSFISRIRRPRGGRQPSADFRYDPLSYALNFDEGPDFDDEEEISPAEFRYRSFSSRLPPTPPQPAPAVGAGKGIACN
ncbi:hypothetical protein Taro_010176 [Colocasia esculenta]|uniref:Uncharacterized protein n=1 Tax=Colocasia esculenta TaxID=4460 RepID=A0A843U2A7_COLES|nr:hypothetical protein [Colocasia esculenta]